MLHLISHYEPSWGYFCSPLSLPRARCASSLCFWAPSGHPFPCLSSAFSGLSPRHLTFCGPEPQLSVWAASLLSTLRVLLVLAQAISPRAPMDTLCALHDTQIAAFRDLLPFLLLKHLSFGFCREEKEPWKGELGWGGGGGCSGLGRFQILGKKGDSTDLSQTLMSASWVFIQQGSGERGHMWEMRPGAL